MSAPRVLDRLERVHKAAPNRWRAICPVHENKNRTQSLAIRELGDGTVLLRCFAGCGVAEILDKLGLQFADLFPDNYHPPAEPRGSQRPNHWHMLREAVQSLHSECLVVALCAEEIAVGNIISKHDRDVVWQAATKIRAAIEACK